MNKYNGDGSLKGAFVSDNGKAEAKVLLGLVEVNGQVQVMFDKEAPISELARFYGMLCIEVPFFVQHMKAMASQKKQAENRIVTPS